MCLIVFPVQLYVLDFWFIIVSCALFVLHSCIVMVLFMVACCVAYFFCFAALHSLPSKRQPSCCQNVWSRNCVASGTLKT